ncbi:MAG TPA: type II toxin-antitoxin system RelE/ParE family toxin [Dongiaceae bacterium]|jgi:addiction module RelE/StbE family toxin|nr:type II toxin-antitoxin system RelE/ParE family toxin [Dongiaceae bacterium]
MKLEWSAPAVEDLRSLHAYISRDSAHYAAAFIERLLDAAERLVDFPESGRQVPEMPSENVRELIVQGYRIIYQIEAGSRVIVLTVVHGRRDLTRQVIKAQKND